MSVMPEECGVQSRNYDGNKTGEAFFSLRNRAEMPFKEKRHSSTLEARYRPDRLPDLGKKSRPAKTSLGAMVRRQSIENLIFNPSQQESMSRNFCGEELQQTIIKKLESELALNRVKKARS